MTRRQFSVLAGYSASAAGYAANETIALGCIGTGGRCRHLMRSLPKIAGVRVTAVCDIWDTHLEAGKQMADPKAFATKDYRALLDRKDIDAVLIGAPDHWHVPLTIAAVQAGKDVYVEKPLTHDLSEGAAVIDAVKKSGRIVQVGMQQRSMPHFQKGYEIVQSGQIGKIHKVHLTWNRNQPRAQRRDMGINPATVDWKMFLGAAREQPFDPYRFRQWRWFWDFGGGLFTDLMVHYIDVVHWYLGLEHPDTAVAAGDQFHARDIWETPDTVQTVLRYPQQQLQAYFEGTFVQARNAAMLEFMGTEATLYLDRGRLEIIPERKRAVDGKPLDPSVKAFEMILGEGPRGADFYDKPDGELLHLSHWFECIRSRKRPNTPVEAGVGSASAAHLANLALRGSGNAKWPAS
jgi:predicted dehydrogenase